MDSQTSLNLSVENDKELQEYEQSNVPNKSNNRSIEIEMQAFETDCTLRKPASNETENDENDEKIDSDDDEYEDETIFNRRALSRTAESYELETFENKIMYIFNQVNREGFDTDVQALRETFEGFGFIVMEKKNSTKDQILSELDKLGEDINLVDYGCVAVVILTWMLPDSRLWAQDEPYTERDIIKCLKVNKIPALVTKPKIIIIQACEYEQMVPLRSEMVYQDSDEHVYYTLPTESDMLIVHSTYSGQSTYSSINGSWFIKTLCNNIKFFAHTDDLESILVRMKRAVAIDREDNEQERLETNNTVNKKMPVVTSTLIRKLYLKQYLGIIPDTVPTNRLGSFVGRVGRVRQSEQSNKQEIETDAGSSQNMDFEPQTD